MATYNRYSKFLVDGKYKMVPFGKIPPKSSDFFEIYKKNETRLDIISFKYYGDCGYGWLIMQANPEYGSMEFDIPDGVTLRIPYPLSDSINDYKQSIDNYNDLY